MATQSDVRRIATAMPGVVEKKDRFAFAVKNKDKLKEFAWVWLERADPKAARVPSPEVLAVRLSAQHLACDARGRFKGSIISHPICRRYI